MKSRELHEMTILTGLYTEISQKIVHFEPIYREALT